MKLSPLGQSQRKSEHTHNRPISMGGKEALHNENSPVPTVDVDTSERYMYQKHDLVNAIAYYDGRVYSGQILEREMRPAGRVKSKHSLLVPQYLVHYSGWTSKYDEWITEEQVVGVDQVRELKGMVATHITDDGSDSTEDESPKPECSREKKHPRAAKVVHAPAKKHTKTAPKKVASTAKSRSKPTTIQPTDSSESPTFLIDSIASDPPRTSPIQTSAISKSSAMMSPVESKSTNCVNPSLATSDMRIDKSSTSKVPLENDLVPVPPGSSPLSEAPLTFVSVPTVTKTPSTIELPADMGKEPAVLDDTLMAVPVKRTGQKRSPGRANGKKKKTKNKKHERETLCTKATPTISSVPSPVTIASPLPSTERGVKRKLSVADDRPTMSELTEDDTHTNSSKKTVSHTEKKFATEKTEQENTPPAALASNGRPTIGAKITPSTSVGDHSSRRSGPCYPDSPSKDEDTDDSSKTEEFPVLSPTPYTKVAVNSPISRSRKAQVLEPRSKINPGVAYTDNIVQWPPVQPPLRQKTGSWHQSIEEGQTTETELKWQQQLQQHHTYKMERGNGLMEEHKGQDSVVQIQHHDWQGPKESQSESSNQMIQKDNGKRCDRVVEWKQRQLQQKNRCKQRQQNQNNEQLQPESWDCVRPRGHAHSSGSLKEVQHPSYPPSDGSFENQNQAKDGKKVDQQLDPNPNPNPINSNGWDPTEQKEIRWVNKGVEPDARWSDNMAHRQDEDGKQGSKWVGGEGSDRLTPRHSKKKATVSLFYGPSPENPSLQMEKIRSGRTTDPQAKGGMGSNVYHALPRCSPIVRPWENENKDHESNPELIGSECQQAADWANRPIHSAPLFYNPSYSPNSGRMYGMPIDGKSPGPPVPPQPSSPSQPDLSRPALTQYPSESQDLPSRQVGPIDSPVRNAYAYAGSRSGVLLDTERPPTSHQNHRMFQYYASAADNLIDRKRAYANFHHRMDTHAMLNPAGRGTMTTDEPITAPPKSAPQPDWRPVDSREGNHESPYPPRIQQSSPVMMTPRSSANLVGQPRWSYNVQPPGVAPTDYPGYPSISPIHPPHPQPSAIGPPEHTIAHHDPHHIMPPKGRPYVPAGPTSKKPHIHPRPQQQQQPHQAQGSVWRLSTSNRPTNPPTISTPPRDPPSVQPMDMSEPKPPTMGEIQHQKSPLGVKFPRVAQDSVQYAESPGVTGIGRHADRPNTTAQSKPVDQKGDYDSSQSPGFGNKEKSKANPQPYKQSPPLAPPNGRQPPAHLPQPIQGQDGQWEEKQSPSPEQEVT